MFDQFMGRRLIQKLEMQYMMVIVLDAYRGHAFRHF
jgi:hypothetical protein